MSFTQTLKIFFFSHLLFFMTINGIRVYSQDIFEYFPEDAVYLPSEILKLSDAVIRLDAGLYAMETQIRFNAGTNLVLEGAGSGLGENATILDFSIYSQSIDDARALSVRGGVTVKNLTIRNVGNRVADLRTGEIGAPSDESVIFENVWFVNSTTGLKSTGGRTVGSATTPMQVKNCVFVNTPEFSFTSPDAFLDFRDTTYAVIDHCDFYNTNNLIQMGLNDPVNAPNDGPVVHVKNSILVSTNGAEIDDIIMNSGTLTLENSLLWDSGSSGGLLTVWEGTLKEIGIEIGDPMYTNVNAKTLAELLDFHLQSDSPAIGLGNDGRDAGSIANELVGIREWSVFE